MLPALWLALPAPHAHGQVGFTSGSAYHNLMGFQHLAPLVGVDISAPRVTNTLWWSSARKSYVGDGWTIWEQGAFYFNRGSFGAGPAALIRYTSNSQYSKTSVYPSVAVQCRAAGWRVEGFVHLRDQGTLNHGRGASIMVRRELAALPNQLGVSLRTGLTIMRFSDGLPGAYGTVMQFGVVITRRSPL
jgi:hypothetical protein